MQNEANGLPPRAGQPEAPEKQKKQKKPKESGVKTLVRVLVSLAIIAVGVFLLLFIVAKAAHYDSIAAMLNHMYGEWQYMWQNRTR